MELNKGQMQTLAAHIRANVTPAVVDALAIRDDVTLMNEYNKSSTRDVWRVAMDGLALWDAMIATQYDGITVAAKRELWMKMIDIADRRPFDMSMAKNRNTLGDIWVHLNAAQLNTLYAKCVEKALICETVFTITDESASTTTAGDRSKLGPVTLDNVSDSLNLPV